LTILADSGIRSGLDVVKMLALGADAVMLGRAYIYALAADGESGVTNFLSMVEKEMKTTMTLIGADAITRVDRNMLAFA
jgi:L-lactate dehydrogenase (cytochrome)